MSRAFNASATAHALNVDPKWLDNLLTQNEMAGIERATQGIPRQLTPEAVTTLYIAKQLISSLGATARNALEAAQAAAQNGETEIAVGVRLTVDLTVVNELLSQRLLDAVQAAPPKTRGRPRRLR